MSLSVVTPLWQDRPAIENLEVATNAERLGYPELWIGEMATFDAFAFATAVASRPGDMTINVGPLAVSIRTPVSMAMGIASVGELCGRNARLAIGTSSTVVVERWHGRSRSRPAKRLEEAAMVLNGLLDGEKVDFAGELTRCAGYRMRLDTAGADVTVAAFGPAAIRVAARHGSRMLLNMVTPKTLSRLKEALAAEARAAGRPEPPLAVWLACAVDPDEAAIAQIMRAKVGYIAAPGYGEMFMEAGYEDLVALARGGAHPREVLAAMPQSIVDSVCLVGDESAVRGRISEYRNAGADEICIVPATAGDDGGVRTLEALAG